MRYHVHMRVQRTRSTHAMMERELVARRIAKGAKAAGKRKRKTNRRPGKRDLPTQLLAATQEILREQGLHKFTLREAARRAGVSHGAPAVHFKDASGLLTAFAAEGYRALRELMLEYRVAAPKDAAAQLVAVGRAYIDYAVAHRPQFQLMFRSDVVRSEDEGFESASKGALQQLKETMSPLLGADETEAGRTAKLMLAWSVVHGFATLYLEKGFHPFYDDIPNPPVSADAKRVLDLLTVSFMA